MNLSMNITWFASIGLLVYLTFAFQPTAESFVGYVDNAELAISSDFGGRIEKIHVATGDRIEAGQLLIELVDLNLDIELSEIEHHISGLQMSKNLGSALVGDLGKENLKLKTPTDVELALLKDKRRLLLLKKQSLTIKAIQPGIIGTIAVSAGQYVPAYQPLILVYQSNPMQVFGFLHEDSLATLKEGDVVIVASIADPRKKSKAMVAKIGGRYTHLPERLQTPQLVSSTAWGRLLQINMTEPHELLPSEKVSIRHADQPATAILKTLNLSMQKPNPGNSAKN